MTMLHLRPVALYLLFALNTAQADETTLTTVNVTAKGYATADIDTPNAVLNIDAAQINASGAQNVGEALRGHAGLAVNSDGAWGQNPVIRGLKRESVVVLTDGIRLNSAQPYGALTSMVEAGLLEGIEVVKGPASVVHGSGALGGVINLIGPQARFGNGVAADLGLGIDSASSGRYGTAKLNLGAKEHALMLAAAYRKAGDYQAPDGKVNHTAFDSQSVLGQYRMQIVDQTSLRVGAERHTDNNLWYPGSTQRPSMPAGLGAVTIHSPKQERTRYEAGIEHQGRGENPFSWQAGIYRQQVYREIMAWSSTLERDRVRTPASFDTDGAHIKSEWLIHPQHLLSFGLEGWTMTADPKRRIDSNPPLYNSNTLLPPFSNGKLTSHGAYVQDEWTVDALKLNAGLRHDQVSGDAASYLVPKLTMPQGFTSASGDLKRTDSATSWSLGGLWQLSKAIVPYINIAHAFRAPDLRERYESSERGDGYFYFGNPRVKPETALNAEAGIKGASPDFSYTAAIYRNRITDYLAGRVTGQTFQGSPVKMTENIGHATIKGIDIEGRYRLTGSQYLLGALTIVRGWNDVDHEPLTRMPADELSLGWEGGIATGWTADARLRLVDRQNRIAAVFTHGTENATAGFITADIGANWRIDKNNNLRLALRNLADKAYHEHLAEGVSGSEINAVGRSFQMSWKGSF